MNKLSIYSSTILLSATSCGETFYPDFDTDPVAVLNSMIIPGENISAEVTHSFVSSAGLMNKDLRIIKDATVSLFSSMMTIADLCNTILKVKNMSLT